AGTATCGRVTTMASRMRVSIAASGSVRIFGADPLLSSPYQLALRTPGINPWSANLRKQIRQMPNLRYTARARPQILQRRFSRVVNFGDSLILANLDLLATEALPVVVISAWV